MDTRLPANFVTFADSTHGRHFTDSTFSKALPFLIAGCMLAIIAIMINQSLIIMTIAIFSLLFASTIMLSMRTLINYPLAINSIHPWAYANDISETITQVGGEESRDSEAYGAKEDGEIAKVMLWTPEKNWFELGDSTIRVARNPVVNKWEIVANDREGTRLGELTNVKKRKMKWFEQLTNHAIMQAQIFNGGAQDDTFADARAREEQESGLLEREWENTTPGLLGNDDVLSVGMRSAIRDKATIIANTPSTEGDDEE
jgi:hypothetical protein